MSKIDSIYDLAKQANVYLMKYPRLRNIAKKVFIKWQSKKNSIKIKGNNNQLDFSDAIASHCSFNINGDNNKVFVDSEAVINNLNFYIRGSNHHIYIGQNCRFIDGGNIWIEDDNCNLSIGNNSYIINLDISITESNSSVEIGKDCLFAYNIDIRNGDSHSIIDLNSGERINQAQDIKIGDRVWIGAYSKILKGVTIETNSVVGIASVVTKDIPSNTAVAGVPAKVIRENITWDANRI